VGQIGAGYLARLVDKSQQRHTEVVSPSMSHASEHVPAPILANWSQTSHLNTHSLVETTQCLWW